MTPDTILTVAFMMFCVTYTVVFLLIVLAIYKLAKQIKEEMNK